MLSPQRIAFLKAILANPGDDLPRLVFADWLEENGTSDADAARVEFIRLGCKSKAKTRLSVAEGKWLDANWQRLLGNTISVPLPDCQPAFDRRSGRMLRVRFFWYDKDNWVGDVVFEYERGFARRVNYPHLQLYPRIWQLAAMDEPIAYHGPDEQSNTRTNVRIANGARTDSAILRNDMWGDEVFSRVIGYDQFGRWEDVIALPWPAALGSMVKVFRSPPDQAIQPEIYHPLAVLDAREVVHPSQRLWVAVATAMTSLAHEHVGITSQPPAG